MILLADSEGSVQTSQADLGLHCPHMPEDTISHGTPQCALNIDTDTAFTSAGVKCCVDAAVKRLPILQFEK